jgi:hypothetical protein
MVMWRHQADSYGRGHRFTPDRGADMNITAAGLTKATAAAAATAGALFIAVQIGHPGHDAFTTETTQWVARCSVKLVMSVLALAGITGMYLRQYRRAGVLGLVGYLLFAVGYLAMFGTQVIATTILPDLVRTEPAFVNDVVAAAAGIAPKGDIGALQTLFTVAGVGYLVGGLLFGIALFRAGLLARWACVLLAVSTAGTVALKFLPVGFDRPFAVPEGIALIALGISLWRHATDEPTATVATTAATPEPAVR